jgi:hypothetical protein
MWVYELFRTAISGIGAHIWFITRPIDNGSFLVRLS